MTAVTVPLDQVPAVAGHLVAAGRQQLRGRHAVAGQESLHVGGGCVAGLARVDHHDRAAGAGQDQGGGQAGGAAADHCYVVLVHGVERRRSSRSSTTMVAVSGNRAVQWAP